ncbi:MAG TPA: ATP-binding protein [Anaerolineales bacterium]|nr:ATP-binding protein [Anaerolineales bacterium]
MIIAWHGNSAKTRQDNRDYHNHDHLTEGAKTFSTKFQLMVAMNPCPCGYWNNPQKPWTCAPAVVTKYQKRISDPMLDRIDIHIEVPRVDYEKLSEDRLGESSETIRAHVQATRDIQLKRFSNNGSDIICNEDMRVGEIWQFCRLQCEGQSLMRAAMSQMNLSARAYAQHYVTASSNWRVRLRIWRGAKILSQPIW